jgi:PAS domain S-box-containing protein
VRGVEDPSFQPLRILVVEDSPEDAELMRHTLAGAGLEADYRTVDNEDGLRARLVDFAPELILTDYALPSLNGVTVVGIAHAWNDDVPCILVSGTLGEELAVTALKAGATDYVLKRRLDLLAPAVIRALTEVDERRQHRDAERAAIAAQATMMGSLEAMLDPFLVCSPVGAPDGGVADLRIDYANSAAADFMGRAGHSLVDVGLSELLLEARESAFMVGCARVLATGGSWTEEALELSFATPAGIRRCLVGLQVVHFGDGLFAVLKDVTEREKSRLERERLATVVEQTVDGVVIINPDGRVAFANHAFLSTYGANQDVTGRPILEVLSSWSLTPEVLEAFGRAASRQEPWYAELTATLRDGSTLDVSASMSVVVSSSGLVTGYVALVRDLTALRRAEAEVVLQDRIRAVLASSLAGIPEGATLEQAAQAITDELITLPFVDLAAVHAFIGPGEVEIIGFSAPGRGPVAVGMRLPTDRGSVIAQQTRGGPWAEYVDESQEKWAWAAGLELRAAAYGPIRHGDSVSGALVVATADAHFARTLVEKMPAVVSFGTATCAVLAQSIEARRRRDSETREMAAVLEGQAFGPVFQPIVDLQSGEIVGFEALTRFDSGERPDECFSRAWLLGLGAEFELAAIRRAVAASEELPHGCWLALNLSHRVLMMPDSVRGVIEGAGRPVVLEITEHDRIDDYPAIRGSVQALGRSVRLAVDDAGAGQANFAHIVELSPDYVKLDLNLVRRINASLERQALVVAMRHFSRTTGCRLVAEGVETADEAATLQRLGADFGQGYLFGRPAPAAAWRSPGVGGLATVPLPYAPLDGTRPHLADSGAVDLSVTELGSEALPPPVSDAALTHDAISVVIVDGHPLVGQAMGALLSSQFGFAVRAVAADVDGAARLLKTTPVDVVLCDIQLGDESGFDLLRQFTSGHPAFVMYSAYDHPIYHRAAVQGGAAGFVLKTAQPEELAVAIESAAAGGVAFSPSTVRAARLMGELPTVRELAVLVQLAEGKSTAEIAGIMGVSPRTVDGHLGHLFGRTGVMSRTELVSYAIKEGWIRPKSAADGSVAGEAQGRREWVVDAALIQASAKLPHETAGARREETRPG